MTPDVAVQLLVSGLMNGGVYALIGMSYSFLYRGTNRINFATGDFFMIGAFVTWTIVSKVGMPYGVGPLAATIALAAVGLLIYRTIIRWISKRNGKLVDVIVATIGLSILLQNTASVVWGTVVRAVPNPLPGIFEAGSFRVPRQSLGIVAIALVTVVVLYLFLTYTKFGMAMRATANNRYAASIVGVNTRRVDGVTWAIAAGVVGIAGAAIAPLTGAHFFMGVITGLKGFAAAVVGGFGNPWGALVGGLALGVIETFGVFVVESQWRDMITMMVLIGFLVLKPNGLFNVEAYDEQ